MQIFDVDGQMCLFDQDGSAGKTSRESTAAEVRPERTCESYSRKSSELKYVEYLSLDLTPGAGNLLGESYWETRSPWRFGKSTLNTGVSPSIGRDACLSLILQETVPPKYYLSRRSCIGILRRAYERGKPLPLRLELALRLQAGLLPPDCLSLLNQQDDQALVAFFSAGAGSTAGSIAYSEKCSPSLRGTASGNMMPAVLCLCDQGGKRMDVSEDIVGTLRAQDHGHHPIVMEQHGLSSGRQLYGNHAGDARYDGPCGVSPTLSAMAGTGGGNLPMVANDRPQFFKRQRVDVLAEGNVASAESARQYKDATDLVLQGGNAESQPDNDNSPAILLIRRLTPTEAERLMGFPDGYTDIPGASDSKRYQALGNSIVVPCLEYIMRGIALAAGESVDIDSSEEEK